MRFKAQNGPICEYIPLLRANQIAGFACDFKRDIIHLSWSWLIITLIFYQGFNTLKPASATQGSQPNSAATGGSILNQIVKFQKIFQVRKCKAYNLSLNSLRIQHIFWKTVSSCLYHSLLRCQLMWGASSTCTVGFWFWRLVSHVWYSCFVDWFVYWFIFREEMHRFTSRMEQKTCELIEELWLCLWLDLP